jgi:hypothetical protein
VADRYIDVSEEQLVKLHDALGLLEMIDRETMRSLDLCLYGITQQPYNS